MKICDVITLFENIQIGNNILYVCKKSVYSTAEYSVSRQRLGISRYPLYPHAFQIFFFNSGMVEEGWHNYSTIKLILVKQICTMIDRKYKNYRNSKDCVPSSKYVTPRAATIKLNFIDHHPPSPIN